MIIRSVNRNLSPSQSQWRDVAILALHRNGVGPSSISSRLDVDVKVVIGTLRGIGGFEMPAWPVSRKRTTNNAAKELRTK